MRRHPARAEARHQQLVDAREARVQVGQRRDRVVVAVVAPREGRVHARRIGVGLHVVADVHVAGAVRHVDHVEALGGDVLLGAAGNAGVGAVHERRHVLRLEVVDVVGRDAVRMRGAEHAGAAAARVVVPAGAAALERDQEVIGRRAVVVPEAILRAVAADRSGQLHLLPCIGVAAVHDVFDADRARLPDREGRHEQRDAPGGESRGPSTPCGPSIAAARIHLDAPSLSMAHPQYHESRTQLKDFRVGK